MKDNIKQIIELYKSLGMSYIIEIKDGKDDEE